MSLLELVLLFSFALIAFLYTRVRHGGSSGYLAIIPIAGVAPAMMKSSALIMNLAVSTASRMVAGSYYGSKKLNLITLKYLLAAGLRISSFKLFFT